MKIQGLFCLCAIYWPSGSSKNWWWGFQKPAVWNRLQDKVNLSVGQTGSYCWEPFCSGTGKQYFLDRYIFEGKKCFEEVLPSIGRKWGWCFLLGLEKGALFEIGVSLGLGELAGIEMCLIPILALEYKFELIESHTNALNVCLLVSHWIVIRQIGQIGSQGLAIRVFGNRRKLANNLQGWMLCRVRWCTADPLEVITKRCREPHVLP